MRNLIICCDGTWNSRSPDPKQGRAPTNVVRLHESLARTSSDGTLQVRYYHTGLGTEGGPILRAWQGLTGSGLDHNIMSAYRWLGAEYRLHDRIFLFGFSRGAYTVRSLGGMLSKCGLLNLTGLGSREIWRRIERAYHQGYRGDRNWTQWSSGWKFHGPGAGKNAIPIHFIGVWDTVGSLGIPAELGVFGLFQSANRRQFHDTSLGQSIAHARHAVSIDEMRSTFVPTLWTRLDPKRDIKQLWFAGAHADIGGGHTQRGLPDIALEWMLKEGQACGLGIRDSAWQKLNPNPHAKIQDSYTGLFRALKYRPRAVPRLSDPARIHDSALRRHLKPSPGKAPYHPTHRLAVGEAMTLPVHARLQWNPTGIYLETGARYRFDAAGQWMNREQSCGPTGMQSGPLNLSGLLRWLGSVMGWGERAFRWATGNQEVDFWASRRIETLPWFSLVGVLANGRDPDNRAARRYHTIFGIGQHRVFPGPEDQTVARPGYLWCFANDAWRDYENNRGALELTVTRVA